MNVEVLEDFPDSVEYHPLLSLRDEGENKCELPEPTWVVPREEKSLVVWSADTEPTRPREPILAVREPEGSLRELVLGFWERYRGFSELETARIVEELAGDLSGEQRRGIADRLDLPPSEPLFEALGDLGEYPRALLDRLAEGELSLRLFRYFPEVPPSLRSKLVDGLAAGTLGLSVQELRQLEEASRRLTDGQREEWCERTEELVSEENPREAGKRLLELTRSMAYPRTRKRRQKFQESLEELDLDGRIQITPPKNFEGDYLDVKFRCHRDEDITRIAEELKRCQSLLEHL